MESIYVIYEVDSDNYKNLNGLLIDKKYLTTYTKEQDMISRIESEMRFQCLGNEGWSFKRVVDKDSYTMIIYYGSEEQYRMIGKEIRL